MNFNIYLNDRLVKKLTNFCDHSHKKKNEVVRNALVAYLHKQMPKSWSESCLKYKGMPDMESFEKYRQELNNKNRQEFIKHD